VRLSERMMLWLISLLFAGGCAALLIFAVNSGTAQAQYADEDRAALIRAKQQAAEAEARSVKLAADAENAADSADAARKQAAAVAASIQAAEAGIEAAEVRLSMVQSLLNGQRQQLSLKQAPMLRLTGALQSLSRQPPLAVLAQPGSLSDMVHVRIVLNDVMPEIEKRTATLKAEVARTRALREDVALATKALKDEQAKLASRRTELVKLEGQRRLQSRQLASSAAIEADRAIARGEEARDLTALIDDLAGDAATRDRLAQLSGPVIRPAAPGNAAASSDAVAADMPSGPPPYRLPVLGKLVAGFGEATQNGTRSAGLSIRTRAGAQIVAPADGRIAFAGPYRGYGTILIIDHANGWSSLITNLIAATPTVGASVAQGEPLGRAGPDRPVITIELRRQGRPVDIVPLLG
jgi:murein hydrolase activator